MKLIIVLLEVLLMGNCLAGESVQGWDYGYEDHAKGTKSESISGELRYRGSELPKEFGHVITPLGEFDFASEMGFSGVEIRWAPFAGRLTVAAQSVESLLSGAGPTFRKCKKESRDARQLDVAYIPGTFEHRPEGTGSDWFYVVKPEWWVNPKKLEKAQKDLIARGL